VGDAVLAEVRFGCWTPDGKMRFPRFLGLRYDKPALAVVRESE
jgi:ATP-dependent DNA ligase